VSTKAFLVGTSYCYSIFSTIETVCERFTAEETHTHAGTRGNENGMRAKVPAGNAMVGPLLRRTWYAKPDEDQEERLGKWILGTLI